jgi:hypothetical protein
LVGTRTITKVVENYYKDTDIFFDTRFLELPLGPYDIIEVGLDVEQGQTISIAGSSYSYDPFNRS